MSKNESAKSPPAASQPAAQVPAEVIAQRKAFARMADDPTVQAIRADREAQAKVTTKAPDGSRTRRVEYGPDGDPVAG